MPDHPTSIPAWSAAEQGALVAVLLLPLPFLLGALLWLLPQYNLPAPLVVGFGVFFVVIFSPGLRVLWQRRRLIPLGFRRVLRGPAEVAVTPPGFAFSRRRGSERYGWDDVIGVERVVDREAGQDDEYEVVLQLRGGVDVRVEDDAEWSQFDVLDRWSGGTLRPRCV